MANIKHTTPSPKAPPPPQIVEDHKPPHVLLAPNVSNRLSVICINGSDIIEIAGLLELCSRDIYKEAVAIKKQSPDALTEHTEILSGHIDFLAGTLRGLAAKIEKEAGEANDVIAMMAKGGEA